MIQIVSEKKKEKKGMDAKPMKPLLGLERPSLE
jgi:hypothetical protein